MKKLLMTALVLVLWTAPALADWHRGPGPDRHGNSWHGHQWHDRGPFFRGGFFVPGPVVVPGPFAYVGPTCDVQPGYWAQQQYVDQFGRITMVPQWVPAQQICN